ncbi:heme-binding domain-containing protein [Algoriphagus boritolerans]|uniref:Haem-binding domain-containing protein n=1 Tax=Algoriphagus boritolerans DSM 17298 = JCM 18970 TaxID=1120964 RepID=A0A1H5ZSP2_9BACT|nr:heme-binding domain-containing protein [Algoriphagus boritolerans]SEG39449.1 Haem-binding domain-containing protein [Algoriphagus boritolerans DSM 17298 = JCM 18970]
MIKKITLGLVVLLILIQFIPAEKNESNDTEFDITKSYEVPDNVAMILKGACNDCHSNLTRYPWYSNIQPIKYFLADHVNEGKREWNLSTFTKLPLAVQNHKFEEVVEMVEEKEMPLASYTYFGLHPEANLTDEERKVLIDWAKDQMAMLAATYPADSLKMKPRAAPAN